MFEILSEELKWSMKCPLAMNNYYTIAHPRLYNQYDTFNIKMLSGLTLNRLFIDRPR